MTTSSISPNPWEVWLAYLRFADNPEKGKVRPIVVLDDEAVAIIAAKVTTAAPHPQFRYFTLEDWRDEGLLYPSKVQIAPLFFVSLSDFLNDKPIGVLSERDKASLEEALSSCDGLEAL